MMLQVQKSRLDVWKYLLGQQPSILFSIGTVSRRTLCRHHLLRRLRDLTVSQRFVDLAMSITGFVKVKVRVKVKPR